MRRNQKKPVEWFLTWPGIVMHGRELNLEFNNDIDLPQHFRVKVLQEHYNQTGEKIIGEGRHAKLVSTGNKPELYSDRKQAAAGDR